MGVCSGRGLEIGLMMAGVKRAGEQTMTAGEESCVTFSKWKGSIPVIKLLVSPFRGPGIVFVERFLFLRL